MHDLPSMRPRLGGRGRVGPGYRVEAAGSPFNEAPARWPGKRCRASRSGRADALPSMRPRLGGRGRESKAPMEWGRRPLPFNEAPARWPGKSRFES